MRPHFHKTELGRNRIVSFSLYIYNVFVFVTQHDNTKVYIQQTFGQLTAM